MAESFGLLWENKKWGGGIELGMGIWLVPVIEYYFKGLRGEEQKNEGRNMRVRSKADIEYSIKWSRAGASEPERSCDVI